MLKKSYTYDYTFDSCYAHYTILKKNNDEERHIDMKHMWCINTRETQWRKRNCDQYLADDDEEEEQAGGEAKEGERGMETAGSGDSSGAGKQESSSISLLR